MNGFFKPLRRKIGVITLGLTCVLMAGWVRSQFVCDSVTFSTTTYPYISIVSESGLLDCMWFDDRIEFEADFKWAVSPIRTVTSNTSANIIPVYCLDTPKMHTYLNSFHYGRELAVRYWILVIPLTLLSTWLLLSKVKQSKPATETSV